MPLDTRRTLTKAKILKALENYPDDEPIMINVEFEDRENWDTWNACFFDLSCVCFSAGSQHTEPEMDWEMVLHVKFGEGLGIMEKIDEDNNDDRNTGQAIT